MPNLIKSASTISTGSVKKNNFLVATDSSFSYAPTSITDFWSGITPPLNGYTVYAQKLSQGPSIRVASTDSELITISKQYGGTNINTIYDALSYFNSQPQYMVVNIDYESIITSGLTLSLDAGYLPSYPRTGNTINDISGNVNNGTLTNGPTFSGSNNGSIVFDGVNDYLQLPNNFFSYPSLTTFSISLWFKSSQSTGGTLFGQQDSNNPSSSSGWVPVIYLQSNGLIRVEPFWTNSISNFIVSTSSLNNNVWHCVTTTYSNGTNKLYIDGIYVTERTGLSLTNYTSVYYYMVGAGFSSARGLGSNYFSGSISNFMFYNRSLASTEVLQNYNAQKERFI